jgi:hypothetical protein
MANYTMTSNDNVRMIVDANDDETDRVFTIESGSSGNNCLMVGESLGPITVYATVRRTGFPIRFKNTTGANDIVSFQSGGSPKALITFGGKFVSFGGMRLQVVTGSDPNTAARAGVTGDLVIWDNAGSYEIWACNTVGVNTWNRATQ